MYSFCEKCSLFVVPRVSWATIKYCFSRRVYFIIFFCQNVRKFKNEYNGVFTFHCLHPESYRISDRIKVLSVWTHKRFNLYLNIYHVSVRCNYLWFALEYGDKSMRLIDFDPYTFIVFKINTILFGWLYAASCPSFKMDTSVHESLSRNGHATLKNHGGRKIVDPGGYQVLTLR